MSNLRIRIQRLRAEIDAATRTGKAYAACLDALTGSLDPDAEDEIAVDVWTQEIQRLEALVDEMTETVNSHEHEIAYLERKAASVA